MKKYFLSAAILVSLAGYTQQLQNANWCFGNNAGLSFTGLQIPASISSSIYTTEGCATLSDNNGALLFYTNGVTVYRSDGSTMPNGEDLKGHNSSTQSATIIPRPGNTTAYIFTIDGVSGQHKGLHYSEVDLSNNGTVLLGEKNIPLRDENDVEISTDYLSTGNMSEKATSAAHCNGTDYWFVSQIADKIYSYQITSAGVPDMPTAVSTAPYNLQIWDYASFGQMKISHDGTRIAIVYSTIYNTTTGEKLEGAVIIGDFDCNTGEVVFDTTVQPGSLNSEYFGVEFSPNSELLYFGINTGVYNCNAKDPVNPNPTFVTPSVASSTAPNKNQFQVAVDGKIYIADNDAYSHENSKKISVINNPNDAGNPDLRINSILLDFGSSFLGLPSWVHEQPESCPLELTFIYPEFFFPSYTYQVSDHITMKSYYTVVAGQDITMKAENYIEMLPNTIISNGSIFTAKIAPCTATSSPIPQQRVNKFKDSTTGDLKLYPNPSSDYVNLNAGKDTITGIIVTSLEGKIMFKASNTTSEFILNVSGYAKGLYIVSVEIQSGSIYTKKLIVP